MIADNNGFNQLPVPGIVNNAAPRVGIMPNKAIRLLTEANESSWYPTNDTVARNASSLERKKGRNCWIAGVAAVAAAVATFAIYVFAMVAYYVIPNDQMIPNPLYQKSANAAGDVANTMQRAKQPYKQPEFIHKDEYSNAVLGTVFGAMFIPVIVGFATWAIVGKSLQEKSIKPMRELREEIKDEYNENDGSRDLPQLDQEYINRLMKRCEDTGRRILLQDMTFDQLAIAKEVLGERKFRRLIRNFEHDECRHWKMIIDFGRKNKRTQEQALNALSGNQDFRNMLLHDPKSRQFAKEKLKVEATHQNFDIEFGFVAPVVEEEQEKFTVNILDQQFEFPREWILAKSHTFADIVQDTGENEIEIPAHPGLDEPIVSCLRIIKGEEKIASINNLDTLAQAANYLQLDDLVLEIGREMIKRYRKKTCTKQELLAFAADRINDNTSNGQAYRIRILKLLKINEVHDSHEFKSLWPLAQKLSQVQDMCFVYYRSLLENKDTFRMVYEMAAELDSDVLAQECVQHLVNASEEYKNAVRTQYGDERIPEDISESL